ncbi:hypothetical protein ACS0TY_011923 [Phlomoides rotata]
MLEFSDEPSTTPLGCSIFSDEAPIDAVRLPEFCRRRGCPDRDLSSNSLSGSIPTSLGNFLGNRELCGKQVQMCKSNGSSAFTQPGGSGEAICADLLD